MTTSYMVQARHPNVVEVEAQRHGQAPAAKHGFCEGLDMVFVEPLPLRASVADMRRTY